MVEEGKAFVVEALGFVYREPWEETAPFLEDQSVTEVPPLHIIHGASIWVHKALLFIISLMVNIDILDAENKELQVLLSELISSVEHPIDLQRVLPVFVSGIATVLQELQEHFLIY